ncbi:MAG: hypothetical protein M1840_003904 [Geoglossum simile]|nr:MAG: hypothetical protein M1840_003904 [Geoglossum simile]
MSETRTVVWSSLYRFSTEAALDIITLFKESPEGRENTCRFDEAADTFLINCTADSERSCRETIHAIITRYIDSHTSQERETTKAPRVERIKETRLSDATSEGDDEKPTDIETDDSPPEDLAKFEFICTWCAAQGNQDLAGTYFNGVYLVEELARGTFCATRADFSKGIITIGGDDYSAVMKIFAKLENIEKHYIRNKRRLEIHLVEIEGEDRRSVQLRFLHLAQVQRETEMARTTLTAQVSTQQYPLLSVARLLRYDHDLHTFYLPKMQLKPIGKLRERSKPRGWAGYVFKSHGQIYDILKKDMSTAAVLPPTGMVTNTVQKWVDSNPVHSALVGESSVQKVDVAEDPDPPAEKHAKAPSSRQICRTRRVKVRPKTQGPPPPPSVPRITEVVTRDPGVELPLPIPAAIKDDIGQSILIDVVDHQDITSSLVEPLLPASPNQATSPPVAMLGDIPAQASETNLCILAKLADITMVGNTDGKDSTAIAEKLQEVNEVDTREFRRTMGQRKELMDAPTIDDSNLRMLNDGAKIALENALGFVGLVELKMEIGRILVRDVPDDLLGTGIDLVQWANFPFKGTTPEAAAEPLFTNFLMTSATEAEFIIDLETDGQRIFGETPYMSTVHYELFCVDKEEVPYTIYIDGETFEWDVKELQMTFGCVYRHFPIRSWDSKLAVKGTLFTTKYNGAAKSIVDSIYIPSNKEQLQMTFQCTPNSDLRVLRVMLKRETRYISYPKALKIALCITQTQRLKIVQSTTRPETYTASASTSTEMVSDNRLWYSVALVSQEAEIMLKENLDIDIGEEPSWSPDEIVNDNIIERLESVSNKVVKMIDDVGFYNKSPHWAHIFEQDQLMGEKESQRGTGLGESERTIW